MTSKRYTILTVRDCILRTGIQDRTYESRSGNQYTILGLPIDKPSGEGLVVLVRYSKNGRESYLSLDKIMNDREVAVSLREI